MGQDGPGEALATETESECCPSYWGARGIAHAAEVVRATLPVESRDGLGCVSVRAKLNVLKY